MNKQDSHDAPSRALYDAWKVKPPCEYGQRICHSGCPYYFECVGDD